MNVLSCAFDDNFKCVILTKNLCYEWVLVWKRVEKKKPKLKTNCNRLELHTEENGRHAP